MQYAYLSQARQVQIANLLTEDRRTSGAPAGPKQTEAVRASPARPASLLCEAAYKRHSKAATGYR
ncbi:hypothetical protein IG631_03210 [Alternaria alternata]|nr:hypothetical protein IG631_03210 [Alternaria alternata]